MFDAIAVVLVFAAYTVTLAAANDLALVAAAPAGLANTIPVVLFGAIARKLVAERVAGRPLAVQIAGNVIIGTAYALLAYWLVTVLLGLVNGASPTDFVVESFIQRAMAWQLLENYTTYAVIACLGYLRAARANPVTVILSADSDGAEREKGLGRYFIRSGEDIRPIDVARIVSISGADDYAEVATLDGRHLVRMTLAEFEQSLDPAKFVRVHRSRIVNLDRIARAEPSGGGRLLLHMEDGDAITASRSGSRKLRDRVL
jgi:hypothetical protein